MSLCNDNVKIYALSIPHVQRAHVVVSSIIHVSMFY